MGDWLQDRCNSIQKAQQEHIQKSFGSDIEKNQIQDLIKAKSMPIGTIHNGFKKVAEGKWRKVSEHGMTKEEHLKISKEHSDKVHSLDNKNNNPNSDSDFKESKKHWETAIKLDSKEYSDKDVHSDNK